MGSFGRVHTIERVTRVRSGVDVIEQFFGLPVGPELFELVRGSPLEHLTAVATQLNEVDRLRPRVSPSAFVPDEFVVGGDQRLAEHGTLKTDVLLCDEVVVEDPVQHWARWSTELTLHDWVVDELARAKLLGRLIALEPVLPLVRAGAITLVNCDDDSFAFHETPKSSTFASQHITTLLEDRVVATAAIRAWPIDAWMYEAAGLDPSVDVVEAALLALESRFDVDVDQEIMSQIAVHDAMESLLSALPFHRNWRSVRDAARFANIAANVGGTPLASSRSNLIHLAAGHAGISVRDEIGRAAQVGIPSAALVSWQDVSALRSESEVYEDLRRTILEVIHAATCDEQRHHPSLAVVTAAAELLPPALERVERDLRRSKILGSAIRAAPRALLAVAKSIAGLPTPGASAGAARIGKHLATPSERRSRALATSRGIYLSLMQQGR